MPKKKSEKPQTSLATRLEAATSLSQIHKVLGIKSWDYTLIGDGSGTRWEAECGWGTMSIENGSFARKLFYGSFNCGTNIIAEMMAYVQPLMYLQSLKHRKTQPDGSTHIHILTDCRYVANAGNQQVIRKKHTAMWKLLDSFQREGFKITYHWVPRDIIDSNKLGHNVANAARIGARDLESAEIIKDTGFDSLFEINPS